jgi:hypothetical protein
MVKRGRPILRWFAAGLCSLVLIGGALAPARDARAETRLVLGTSQSKQTLAGRLQRLIYAEAGRRMGIAIELRVLPLQGLTIAAEQGLVDGDVARTYAYGNAHHKLVRVEESIYDVTWALFATNTALTLDHVAALAGKTWRVTYLRGAALCEEALRQVVPPARLTDVSSDAQGFGMLRLGRTDAHCTADISAQTLQQTSEFRDIPITHRVVDIGTYSLHPYLHESHAELARELAVVLRQMKSERLIDQWRENLLR